MREVRLFFAGAQPMQTSRQRATEEHVLQGGALCVWTLVRAIHLMDASDILLSQEVASEIKNLLREHLLHWQGMSQRCAVLGLQRWKVRPKHHMLEHIALFTGSSKLNPRHATCFQDESYLGALKRIGVKCHESTMLTRVFQRLFLLLSQRWQQTRTHARQS